MVRLYIVTVGGTLNARRCCCGLAVHLSEIARRLTHVWHDHAASPRPLCVGLCISWQFVLVRKRTSGCVPKVTSAGFLGNTLHAKVCERAFNARS
jgi:hypothetical protein